MTTLLEARSDRPVAAGSLAPCPPWCLGAEHHRVHGDDECAGQPSEVVPGVATWPVARRGGPVRFVVVTTRPDVTVTL